MGSISEEQCPHVHNDDDDDGDDYDDGQQTRPVIPGLIESGWLETWAVSYSFSTRP